tara:strand:- start:265 stop:642 length:378 start_codon:yes stop_codon:yes gene_type:complete
VFNDNSEKENMKKQREQVLTASHLIHNKNVTSLEILESIIKDIGSANVVGFVNSLLSGDDHADARSIINMLEQSTIEKNELSLSVNDTLDYLEEHYQLDDHNVYEEFMHIVTREVNRQFKIRIYV